MDQCKTYSRIRSISSYQSKHRVSNKSRDQINPQKRSVTFSGDVDLIQSISCQENLLDLIGKVQKQQQQYLLSLQNSQMKLLPPLKVGQDEYKIQKQQAKKQINKQYNEFSIPMDPYKKQLYQKLNIYGKFIEPTNYKQVDYQQIQTFNPTISQIQFQECNHNEQPIKIQEKDIQQKMDKQFQQNNNNNISKFDQQYNSNFDHDYDLFYEQQKMNKIINEALKFKQQKRDPINASKSVKQKKTQMKIYLENQYQNALKQIMQEVNVNKDEDNLFLKKKFQKKMKLNPFFNNSKITSQYTKKAISSSFIHPDRQEFVNKTLEIYDRCNTSLN
ncbi:unnamed protein product [Paramecium pentaurelia]|uniref:Uncharacterized protein n=1 Tax=Paramecium pentaurelia TaxID=43138 RepID=A0A8S1SY07_9CILI|nr:unnamed protein product [Paramecium pentaurelia]